MGCGTRCTCPSRSSRSSIADVAGALSCRAALSWPGVVGLAELAAVHHQGQPGQVGAVHRGLAARRPRRTSRTRWCSRAAPGPPASPRRRAAARRVSSCLRHAASLLFRSWKCSTVEIKTQGRAPRRAPAELGRGAGRHRALRGPARRRGRRARSADNATSNLPRRRRVRAGRPAPGPARHRRVHAGHRGLRPRRRGARRAPTGAPSPRKVARARAGSPPTGRGCSRCSPRTAGPPSSPCRSPRTPPSSSSAAPVGDIRGAAADGPARRAARQRHRRPGVHRRPLEGLRRRRRPLLAHHRRRRGPAAAHHLPQPVAVAGAADRRRGSPTRWPRSCWPSAPTSFGFAVDGATTGITSVLVFGAGTNYALLLIARYREELRREEDRYDAMRVALDRAAPAILASSGTVVLGPALPRLRGQPVQPQPRLRRRDRHRDRGRLRACSCCPPR